MYQLYFNPSKFPRTIKRKEWKDIWRWKRVTEKRVKEEVDKQISNLIVYGSTMPRYIKDDIMEELIYPLLLIHDKQEPL